MATHLELGKQGEELAVEYLVQRGFSILQRNWRYSYCEIDIIALKNGMPHFVEVKTRCSTRYGMPEESVSKEKIRLLLKAIKAFMARHEEYRDFHLDVLSIILPQNGTPE